MKIIFLFEIPYPIVANYFTYSMNCFNYLAKPEKSYTYYISATSKNQTKKWQLFYKNQENQVNKKNIAQFLSSMSIIAVQENTADYFEFTKKINKYRHYTTNHFMKVL